MGRRRKVYSPVLDDDEHLVPSRKTKGRVRGLSQDSDNKNTNIPEWEEEEINEITPTEEALVKLGLAALVYGGYKAIGFVKNKAIPWVKEKISEKDEEIKEEPVKNKQKNATEIVEYQEESNDTDATDLIDSFEKEFREGDLSELEVRRMLLENYLMDFRIAMNNKRLSEEGIHIDNEKLFSFVENEEICDKLNGFLIENRKQIDDLFEDYNTIFHRYSVGQEGVYINSDIVHKAIENKVAIS